MDEATIAQTILTLSILLIFAGFLIWGIKSGQFHNVEEAKYRMLSDNKPGETKLKNNAKIPSDNKLGNRTTKKNGEEKRK
jgi:cbb3-type cytochrome oxidase maturation protein